MQRVGGHIDLNLAIMLVSFGAYLKAIVATSSG